MKPFTPQKDSMDAGNVLADFIVAEWRDLTVSSTPGESRFRPALTLDRGFGLQHKNDFLLKKESRTCRAHKTKAARFGPDGL